MSREERFVDTGHWVGLADSGDRHHERAWAWSQALEGPFVTTEAILLEVGNTLARARWRDLAVELLEDVRADTNIEVVNMSPELFSRALELYSMRPDKEWGLTDCVSFVVMNDRGIREALSADQHFVQAGFRALLLEEP